MPNPFNSRDDLFSFTSLRPGAGGAHSLGATLAASVTAGEFDLNQFDAALQFARDEIFARCGQLENDEYEAFRKNQLKQGELYLALSHLLIVYSERIALKFPESNLSAAGGGGGNLSIGADTPSPLEKMEGWRKAAAEYRGIGETFLRGQGNAWSVAVGNSGYRTRLNDVYGCEGQCSCNQIY